MSHEPYRVRRPTQSRFIELRGIRHHLLEWGEPGSDLASRPPILMQHGWMDVAASFQFVVDALASDRHVLAFDWRGFGESAPPAAVDTYYLHDYLGDLDAALDALFFGATPLHPRVAAIDLVGHSMGGNLVMLYAGLRPERIRRLVNLEGFGMPATRPAQAPGRLVQWLDGLKQPERLRDYASLDQVAARLRLTNPRLRADRALWLAAHWSRRRDDGRFEIRADPAHKRISPYLYQHAEALECWQRIQAPVLWAEGDATEAFRHWGTRYPRDEFEARLARVPKLERCVLGPAGHMLHHDQPEALAARMEAFFDAD